MRAAKETIDEIVALEWEFFQRTQNIGGRASCQNDACTFQVMWASELMSWSEAMARSWLQDLKQAAREGRNPVAEKYARMMEETAPEEYAALKDKLPPLEPGVPELVDALTAQTLRWADEVAERYPRCCARARPIHASANLGGRTSVETYTRGELKTYSKATLELFAAYYAEKAAQGENLYLEIQDNTARLQGYASLADAEEKLSAK